jgi:hypothetical protein
MALTFASRVENSAQVLSYSLKFAPDFISNGPVTKKKSLLIFSDRLLAKAGVKVSPNELAARDHCYKTFRSCHPCLDRVS